MPDLHIEKGSTEPAAGRPKAVAIVGYTNHRDQAPLGAPGWEVWGLNDLYRYMRVEGFTRWFELHPRSDFEKPKEAGGDPEHIVSLKAFPIPVYMTERHEDIGPSVALPKELIESRVSAYMTSTPAWMLGLALAEGFETIGLFGIDMAQDTEYAQQRPCMEYLLGIAHERKVRIIKPPQSDLLQAAAQYGFESQGSALMLKFAERRKWLDEQEAMQQQQLASLEADYETKSGGLRRQYETIRANILGNLAQIKGAKDSIDYFARSWGTQPPSYPGVAVNPDAAARSRNPAVGPVTRLPAEQIPGAVPPPAGGDGAAATPAPPTLQVEPPAPRALREVPAPQRG